MHLYIINGPNLNMLGTREPKIYGYESYHDLCRFCEDVAREKGIRVSIFQSNCEGEIIDKIHRGILDRVDGIIINPGALSHYSYAIYDALKCSNIPAVEVHLTNIYDREPFRKLSVVAPACKRTYYGKHFGSYREAILYFLGAENVR